MMNVDGRPNVGRACRGSSERRVTDEAPERVALKLDPDAYSSDREAREVHASRLLLQDVHQFSLGVEARARHPEGHSRAGVAGRRAGRVEAGVG